MRMGMLRPMNSNDMIRLSLGRPILATNGSALNRARPCRSTRRFRYPTRAAIAKPTGKRRKGINRPRWLPSCPPSQISPAGSLSSVSNPSFW